MDQEYINNAKNYLISEGHTPDMETIKDTLDDMGILEIYIHNGTQKYVFRGVRASLCFLNGRKWVEMYDASRDWQDFLLQNSIGEERLSVLLAIRDIKVKDYEEVLRDVIRNYDSCKLVYDDEDDNLNYYSSEVASAHKEMLDAEEHAFSYYIATTKDGEQEIERTIRRRQADFAEFHINKIKNFVEREVETNYNSDGEEVYEFTEQQLALYEILKDLRDTTDFVFRHQLYRFDNRKSETVK